MDVAKPLTASGGASRRYRLPVAAVIRSNRILYAAIAGVRQILTALLSQHAIKSISDHQLICVVGPGRPRHRGWGGIPRAAWPQFELVHIRPSGWSRPPWMAPQVFVIY